MSFFVSTSNLSLIFQDFRLFHIYSAFNFSTVTLLNGSDLDFCNNLTILKITLTHKHVYTSLLAVEVSVIITIVSS